MPEQTLPTRMGDPNTELPVAGKPNIAQMSSAASRPLVAGAAPLVACAVPPVAGAGRPPVAGPWLRPLGGSRTRLVNPCCDSSALCDRLRSDIAREK